VTYYLDITSLNGGGVMFGCREVKVGTLKKALRNIDNSLYIMEIIQYSDNNPDHYKLVMNDGSTVIIPSDKPSRAVE
jgi:hypothetical protein